MTRLISRLLVALGLALVGLGRKLEKPAPPPAAKITIVVSRRHYRLANREPGRLRATWLGLSILLSSARFGLGV